MKLTSILLVTLFSIGNFTSTAQKAKEGKATFKIKKGFSTINGQFREIDYNVIFNKDGSGTISGTADISSVSTGNATRDKHLQNKEWFDATNYPKITIQSKKIIKNNDGTYVGTFEIKIKAKTEVHEIPFQVVNVGNGRNLKASFTLPTSAFDIGGGVVSLLVGDKVTVNMELPF